MFNVPVTLPKLEVKVEMKDLMYGNIIAGALIFMKLFFKPSSLTSFNSKFPIAKIN